jgi:hypothetical protein
MEPLYRPEGVEERWQTWEAEGHYARRKRMKGGALRGADADDYSPAPGSQSEPGTIGSPRGAYLLR